LLQYDFRSSFRRLKYVLFNNTKYYYISRYKIRDLSGHGKYLVDMKLSVCFSDGSPCQLENEIVRNYLVTKPLCAWFNGYKVAGKFIIGIFKKKHLKITSLMFLLLH
jgi:hypothetical protein